MTMDFFSNFWLEKYIYLYLCGKFVKDSIGLSFNCTIFNNDLEMNFSYLNALSVWSGGNETIYSKANKAVETNNLYCCHHFYRHHHHHWTLASTICMLAMDQRL